MKIRFGFPVLSLRFYIVFGLALVGASAATASSSPGKVPGHSPGTAEVSPALDIELDPLAFAFNGYSVHGGLRYKHFRFDVGAFGMQLPGFLLSDERFDARMGGFGVKVDYHWFNDVGGPFLGIAASRANVTSVHQPSGQQNSHFVHEIAVRAGYEIDLAWGLYVAPWISVGHMFGSKSITVEGATLDAQPVVTVFPTLHIGVRM